MDGREWHRKMRGRSLRMALVLFTLAMAGCTTAPAEDVEDAGDVAPPAVRTPVILEGSRPGEFTVLVSGATPFTDDCGDPFAGEDARPDVVGEPHVAVDPADPDHLVATWQQDRYAGLGASRSDLVAASFDGGRGWSAPATLAELSACTGGDRSRATDPHVSVGADGVAWFSGMGITVDPLGAEFDGDVMSATSSDGGATWPDPVAMIARDDGLVFHEWPTIAADPDVAGRAWTAWAFHTAQDPGIALAAPDVAVGLARTDDGGATWSVAQKVRGDVPGTVEWPLAVALLGTPEERTLVVPFLRELPRPNILLDEQTNEIWSVVSRDGGDTWDEPVRVASVTGGESSHPPFQVGRDGALMMAWTQYVGQPFPWLQSVHFALSTDLGRTWQVEKIAAPEPPANLVIIGVGQLDDGTIGVAWYDMEGGVTATLATQKDGAWTLRDVAEFDSTPVYIGHYQAMVAMGDAFGLLYTVGELPQGHGPTNVVFTRVPG